MMARRRQQSVLPFPPIEKNGTGFSRGAVLKLRLHNFL